MFDNDNFDKHFARTQKTIGCGVIASVLVSLGVLVFVGWVIVKLLAHFGVI